MVFYDNLKQICEERNIAISALLKNLGLSTSKMDAWKKGSLPKQEVLFLLAEQLHCSVADFFDDEVHLLYKSPEEWANARWEAQAEQVRLEQLPDDERELLEAYRAADRKTQLKIMYYVISLEDIDDGE